MPRYTDDKIVTHADLPVLRALRDDASCDAASTDALLDRLIAAAEADAPPLPEGWVLAEMDSDVFPYWHHNGTLYQGVTVEGKPLKHRDRVGSHNREWLSPLRPGVTEADVEKAVRDLGAVPGWTIDKSIRKALASLDIEVTP